MKKTIKLITATAVMLCLMFVFSADVDAQNATKTNINQNTIFSVEQGQALQGVPAVGTILRTNTTAPFKPVNSLKDASPVSKIEAKCDAKIDKLMSNSVSSNSLNSSSGNVEKVEVKCDSKLGKLMKINVNGAIGNQQSQIVNLSSLEKHVNMEETIANFRAKAKSATVGN